MCAIVGVFWTGQRPEGASRVIDRMAQAVEHRGPDSEGRTSTPFADIGFRRLAIIDLEGGTQPLSNESGTVDCFLNGEIYNYRDLRRELIARGHKLHTDSDTEVLPHLYEEYGEGMFNHLNGMFCVCVVDRTKRQVLLARDHFGIKQLYYAVTPSGVVLGSEMKAVLAAELLEPEIDKASVLPYLAMFYTPEPYTLVKGVRKLATGSWMRLSVDGRVVTERYYEPPVQRGQRRLEFTEAAEETARRLTKAVELQLHADVPVGISLSGGIDSAAITAIAAATRSAGPKPLALTIAWPDTDPAELACAAALCREYGIEQVVLQPPTTEPLAELLTLAWVADEPIADPALYSQLCISASAAQHVKVLLSGAGGDELFGGYGSYRPSWKSAGFMSLPGPLKQLAASGMKRWVNAELMEAMVSYQDSRLLWHLSGKSTLSRAEQQKLKRNLSESRDPAANLRLLFEQYRDVDPLNQQMLADLRTYLPDQILPMVDRATMACSIEGRVPFLDVPLVEFAFSISGRGKMGWPLVAKRLLKKSVENRVPASILKRKKIGMPSPFPRMIAQERQVIRRLLLGSESYVPSLFGPEWINSLLATEENAFRNYTVLYSLLILEVWHRRFIKDRDYKRPFESFYETLEFMPK